MSPSSPDDLIIVATAAAAGQSPALEQLLGEIEALVLSRCRRFFTNPADAEESTQDLLLVVSRRISSFEGRSKFTTWLYQVTSNVCVDTYRRMKRQAPITNVPMPQLEANERTSVLAGGRVDLLDALEQMDRKLAEPVVLREICQLSYEEIAEALAIPEGTVKSRVHEGRKQLTALLANRG